MTASDDGTARIWHPFAPRVKPVVLRGHQREVTDAEFSPDGTRVVTASFDGTARRVERADGQGAHRPAGPRRRRHARRAFSPDGARVVTASADQTARIWDSRNRQGARRAPGPRQLRRERGVQPGREAGRHVELRPHCARLGRGGRRAALHARERAAIPGRERRPQPNRLSARRDVADGDPRVLDAETGDKISTLRVDGARVVSAVFSADGRDVVTADDAGRRARSGTRPPAGSALEDAGGSTRSSPSRAPTPRTFVSLSVQRRDRSAVDDGRPLETAHARSRPRRGASTAAATGARLRRERAPLARLDRGRAVAVWDIASRRKLAAFSSPAQAAFGCAQPRRHARGHRRRRRHRPDLGRRRRPGAEAASFKHALAVVAASFSADGSRLLTAGDDQRARIWDARTGRDPSPRAATRPSWRAPSFDPTVSWVVDHRD